MLSNLVVTDERTIFIKDDLGQERIAQRFLHQLLREQGLDAAVTQTLPFSEAIKDEKTLWKFAQSCAKSTAPCSVVLPTLSDLLVYQPVSVVFQFLQELRKLEKVKRTLFWATTANLSHPNRAFVLAACEYLADIVVHLQTPSELSILTRKASGGVTHKTYTCKRSKDEFLVQLKHPVRPVQDQTATPKPEELATFKIDLEEDELVARNALKLPYEKTSDSGEGNIIYMPDDADDFDDEDPDEDLCM